MEGDGQDEGDDEGDDDGGAEGPRHGGDLLGRGNGWGFGEGGRGFGGREASWALRDWSWVSEGEFGDHAVAIRVCGWGWRQGLVALCR